MKLLHRAPMRTPSVGDRETVAACRVGASEARSQAGSKDHEVDSTASAGELTNSP